MGRDVAGGTRHHVAADGQRALVHPDPLSGCERQLLVAGRRRHPALRRRRDGHCWGRKLPVAVDRRPPGARCGPTGCTRHAVDPSRCAQAGAGADSVGRHRRVPGLVRHHGQPAQA
ncbi:hypothetical protein G6F57_019300 [Rhizopus arrhizus]|nr:hypothetical protein G6F57_019300 [Rhizopus arrhizus]